MATEKSTGKRTKIAKKKPTTLRSGNPKGKPKPQKQNDCYEVNYTQYGDAPQTKKFTSKTEAVKFYKELLTEAKKSGAKFDIAKWNKDKPVADNARSFDEVAAQGLDGKFPGYIELSKGSCGM